MQAGLQSRERCAAQCTPPSTLPSTVNRVLDMAKRCQGEAPQTFAHDWVCGGWQRGRSVANPSSEGVQDWGEKNTSEMHSHVNKYHILPLYTQKQKHNNLFKLNITQTQRKDSFYD